MFIPSDSPGLFSHYMKVNLIRYNLKGHRQKTKNIKLHAGIFITAHGYENE